MQLMSPKSKLTKIGVAEISLFESLNQMLCRIFSHQIKEGIAIWKVYTTRKGSVAQLPMGLLVGGWATHLKNISQNGSFPQIGVNIKKYLKHFAIIT